jgi:hypothetical protein
MKISLAFNESKLTARFDFANDGPMIGGISAERASRPLGDLEKLFWATSLESNVNWVQSIRVSGKFDSTDLRQALALVQNRHPLLSVCVKLDDQDVPHFLRFANCPIPLRDVERKDDVSWIREAEAEINERIDPSHAPLFRAVLVQGEQTNEILLCGTHCNIDGTSIIVIVRDLMNALAKLPTPPSLPMQLPFEELFAPLREAVIPAGWDDSFAPSTAEPPGGQKDSSTASIEFAPPFKIAVWQLDRDQTSRLIESCRKRDVTVHAAICAAFLSSFAKLSQNSAKPLVRCASPINLRSACPPVEDDVGVYISMIVSFHPLGLTNDFWELARSVKEQLNQARQPQNLVAIHAALREKMKLPTATEIVAWSRQAVSYEFGVTNLGKLPIPLTFGPLKIEQLWPPIAVSNPLSDTVAVFTFDDQLAVTITSVADRREFGSLAIESLKDLT